MHRDPDDRQTSIREGFIRALTVITFALTCWVFSRAVTPRASCVRAPSIRGVVIEGQMVSNCAFESRLALDRPVLSRSAHDVKARLERAAAFGPWFARDLRVFVIVDETHPRAFGVRAGSVTIGSKLFSDDAHVRHALALALVRTHPAYARISPFAAEVLAEFIARAPDVGSSSEQNLSFATVPTSLATYCASPARSLAHAGACGGPVGRDQGPSAWGFRSILGEVLLRALAQSDLKQRMRVRDHLRTGLDLPAIESPGGVEAAAAARWLERTSLAFAGALQLLPNAAAAERLRRNLRELDVSAPIEVDVTVDLRHTPRWREIEGQLRARSHFRPRERTLLFTPEGQTLLPVAARTGWSASDIHSAKHVVIGCPFPPARDAVRVIAGTVFARQTCGALQTSFWD